MFSFENQERAKGFVRSTSEKLNNYYSKPPSKKLINDLRVALERYVSLFNEKDMIFANRVLISFYHDLFDVDLPALSLEDKAS